VEASAVAEESGGAGEAAERLTFAWPTRTPFGFWALVLASLWAGPMLTPTSFALLAHPREAFAIRTKVQEDAEMGLASCYYFGRAYVDGHPTAQDGGVMGEHIWEHAEEFLDYLDTAGSLARGLSAIVDSAK